MIGSMIKEDYVSFETAKLLKEKGFDEVCEMFYCKPHEGYMRNRKRNEWRNSDLRENMICTCPTLQMTMKWLREVHKINIEVCLGFDADSELGYFYNPVISDLKNMALAIETPEFDETEFTVYEEAAEAAIKYCLKNLI